jgi:hypothetical protein
MPECRYRNTLALAETPPRHIPAIIVAPQQLRYLFLSPLLWHAAISTASPYSINTGCSFAYDLWANSTPERLPDNVRQIIEASEAVVSVVSLWELITKQPRKNAPLADPVGWWER